MYPSLFHPNIRSSHKQLSFLLVNAAPPFLLRSSRRLLPGPPEVRWHGALRSQLLGVGVQGVGRKRSAEGRPESARVTAEAQALTARHVPPSSACHPFWTLHSLAKHTGHQVTTTSYDPMLQIHNWGIHLKEKGQNCDVWVCSENQGSRSCVSTHPSNRGIAHVSTDDINVVSSTVRMEPRHFLWIIKE